MPAFVDVAPTPVELRELLHRLSNSMHHLQRSCDELAEALEEAPGDADFEDAIVRGGLRGRRRMRKRMRKEHAPARAHSPPAHVPLLMPCPSLQRENGVVLGRMRTQRAALEVLLAAAAAGERDRRPLVWVPEAEWAAVAGGNGADADALVLGLDSFDGATGGGGGSGGGGGKTAATVTAAAAATAPATVDASGGMSL